MTFLLAVAIWASFALGFVVGAWWHSASRQDSYSPVDRRTW